jgi:hypothetical protein
MRAALPPFFKGVADNFGASSILQANRIIPHFRV